MTVIEQVQSFVHTRFRQQVSPTDSLLDAGVIDSVGIFELVSYLEGQFGVKVADDEIVPDNFETVERIAALVERLRRSAGATG